MCRTKFVQKLLIIVCASIIPHTWAENTHDTAPVSTLDDTGCGRIPMLRELEKKYRTVIEKKIAEFDYAKGDDAVSELVEFSGRMLLQTLEKSKGNIDVAARFASRAPCSNLQGDLDRLVADQEKLWQAQVQLVSHFATVVREQIPSKKLLSK